MTDKDFSDNITDTESLPLEERKEDILPLARHFIKLAEEQVGTECKELSKEVEEYLLNYDWHGNEKKLETAIKRACILSEGSVLQVEDFDLGQRQIKSIGKFIEEKLRGFMRNIKRLERFNLHDMVFSEVEKALILMVLKETRGNQLRAAKLLGLNRNTLRSKIKKLGIRIE